jgi:GNAT superfamily N-acetyltransferase
MRAIVQDGAVPGILAYRGSEVVGWCAVAPRSAYPALGRSRLLAPVDEQPCWSISCFFVEKHSRKLGVSRALIAGAIRFAKKAGAEVLEAYPNEPKSEREIPAAFAWTGISTPFVRAGFREVQRRSESRPILRLQL